MFVFRLLLRLLALNDTVINIVLTASLGLDLLVRGVAQADNFATWLPPEEASEETVVEPQRFLKITDSGSYHYLSVIRPRGRMSRPLKQRSRSSFVSVRADDRTEIQKHFTRPR